MERIIRKLLKLLFCVFKTNDTIIVFESADDFTDSSCNLYKYLLKNHEHAYKYVWIVHDLKSLKQKKPSTKTFPLGIHNGHFADFIKGVYYQSIAKYVFYTHHFVGNEYRKKQFRVFITHASPPVKNSSGLFWNPKKNTHILAVSDFAADYRCKTLNGGRDKIVITGLPRNDLLFNSNKKAVIEKLQIETKKIIVWMPTFKHHKNKRRVDFANASNDISIMSTENFKKLQKILALRHITLIIKPHPSQDMDVFKAIESNNIKVFENKTLSDNDIEPYTLLGSADALVTDFSSVYFDYLLVDRPIAFELSDKKTYDKGIGFIFDRPLDYMPGHKIYNIDDFVKFIDDIANDKDPCGKERNKLKELNHKYQDGHSTERVLSHFGVIDE